MRAKINYVITDEIETKKKILKQSYYEAGSKAAKMLSKCMLKQQATSNVH